MFNIKHYQTSKEKFLYGYFIVFLVGASIGTVLRFLVEQYIIAFLDIIAICIVLWLVYDYEKRHNVEFSSLILFWMLSLLLFYYIYHLGYGITIFQLTLMPIAGAITLSPKIYKQHSIIFLFLFMLVMAYGFLHSERYPMLQNNTFVAQAFIVMLFSFLLGFVYHYAINHFNEKLQETNILLSQSNDEKTYLLQEVHHRVKNNLNMMTSILGLQEDLVTTDAMRSFIEQNILRIKSIALVHELLYQEKNFKSIHLESYIRNLTQHILSISKSNAITLHIDIEDIKLNTDDIIHIGIIINELMTNSLKYAFKQNKGCINISLKSTDNNYELSYSDNGKGMENKKTDNKGFGLSLIALSVEHLNGTLQTYYDEGLHTQISFRGTQI